MKLRLQSLSCIFSKYQTYSNFVNNFIFLPIFARNAKVSVDVCLYIFTCPEFGNVLVSCMRRGIIIRVIVDFVSIQENGREVGIFFDKSNF